MHPGPYAQATCPSPALSRRALLLGRLRFLPAHHRPPAADARQRGPSPNPNSSPSPSPNQAAFWGASLPVCLVAYGLVSGHWPDLSDQEDVAQFGAMNLWEDSVHHEIIARFIIFHMSASKNQIFCIFLHTIIFEIMH